MRIGAWIITHTVSHYLGEHLPRRLQWDNTTSVSQPNKMQTVARQSSRAVARSSEWQRRGSQRSLAKDPVDPSARPTQDSPAPCPLLLLLRAARSAARVAKLNGRAPCHEKR